MMIGVDFNFTCICAFILIRCFVRLDFINRHCPEQYNIDTFCPVLMHAINMSEIRRLARTKMTELQVNRFRFLELRVAVYATFN